MQKIRKRTRARGRAAARRGLAPPQLSPVRFGGVWPGQCGARGRRPPGCRDLPLSGSGGGIRFTGREGVQSGGFRPLRIHFLSARGTTERKIDDLKTKARVLTGRGRSGRAGTGKGSPSLPKGSRFLSPSIRLNLGLSRLSLFQWPVASSSRETSA